MTIDTPACVHFSSKQRLILLVLLGAGFMLAIDYSILNVALPTVGAGVGLGLTGLPWIIGIRAARGRFHPSVRPVGRPVRPPQAVHVLDGPADRGLVARRLCIQSRDAPDCPSAAGLRHGDGDPLVIVAAHHHVEGAARNRVLGLNGSLLAVGFTVGSLVGGTLVSYLSWRAAFFINVPVALVILLVPRS